MARRHFATLPLTAAALLLGAADAPPAATIPLGEVRDRDPMLLADRLLPSDIRATVTEGKLVRQFLPGQAWWIGYLTAPRTAGGGICRRSQYTRQIQNMQANGGAAPDDTPLTIKPLEQHEQVALLFPGTDATDAHCMKAQGFIALRPGAAGERQLSAYRAFIAAMHAARGKKPLPFELHCACADARPALADMPLSILYDVSTRSDHIRSENGIGYIQPVKPGDPYSVTLSFGASAPDGKSWRATWREEGRGIADLTLERHSVIYH